MMRSRGAFKRSEAGFAGVLLLAAFLWAAIGGTAAATLISIGQRLGWNSPAGKEIAACVKDVDTALVGINAARVSDPNKELDLTDPNAVVVKRCQALAENLANDPAFGGQARALGRLVNKALASIAECELYPAELEQQAIAGRDYSTNVRAKVPLVGLGVKAQATISGGGVSSTVAIDPTKTSSGNLAIPGANSKNVADGAKSSIGLTASGVALDSENKPVLVRPDGTCPFGLPRVGDECRISCTVTLPDFVTWKVIPKIEVELSASNVDANNASLTWTIKNSKSQKIEGLGIPGGSAGIGPKGTFPVKRGQQEETYTVTASAPDTDSVPKSIPVAAREGGKAFTLTLDALDVATTDSVTVSGRVSPVPPAGTQVGIEVEGEAARVVTVDGSGVFSTAGVLLAKRATVGDLLLQHSSANITTCGGAVRPITLTNKKTDTATTVRAAILSPTADTVQSNIAAMKIEHAVKVLSVTVSWSGDCPAPSETPPAGQIIKGGQTADLGDVRCGIPCPGHGTQCKSTVAHVSVSTTVGPKSHDASWIIDIP